MNTLPSGPPLAQPTRWYWLNAANGVLAVTILTAAVSVVLALPPLSAERIVGVAVFTLLYLGWTIFGYDWCERQPSLQRRLVYFGVALSLSAVILALSRINGIIWLIFMPLASHAAQQPRGWVLGVYTVILLEFLAVLVPLTGLGAALASVAQLAGGLGFVFVFTHIAARESKARVEMEALAGELRSANEKLSEYAAQAEELAITRERNRLAREIHDSLGHYLTVVHVQLEAARALMDSNPAQAKDALTHAQSLTKNGLAEIRQSVAALRASPLDGRSLSAAIQALVEDHRSSGQVALFEVTGEPYLLGTQQEMTLYRAAQEGLTNIRKHAPQATRAWVELEYADKSVCLCVGNDGPQSVPVEGPVSGFGLLGLKERIQLLGGELATLSTHSSYVLQVILFVAPEDKGTS